MKLLTVIASTLLFVLISQQSTSALPVDEAIFIATTEFPHVEHDERDFVDLTTEISLTQTKRVTDEPSEEWKPEQVQQQVRRVQQPIQQQFQQPIQQQVQQPIQQQFQQPIQQQFQRPIQQQFQQPIQQQFQQPIQQQFQQPIQLVQQPIQQQFQQPIQQQVQQPIQQQVERQVQQHAEDAEQNNDDDTDDKKKRGVTEEHVEEKKPTEERKLKEIEEHVEENKRVKEDKPKKVEEHFEEDKPKKVEEHVEEDKPKKVEEHVEEEKSKKVEEHVEEDKPKKVEEHVEEEKPKKVEEHVEEDKPKKVEEEKSKPSNFCPENYVKFEDSCLFVGSKAKISARSGKVTPTKVESALVENFPVGDDNSCPPGTEHTERGVCQKILSETEFKTKKIARSCPENAEFFNGQCIFVSVNMTNSTMEMPLETSERPEIHHQEEIATATESKSMIESEFQTTMQPVLKP